MATGLLLVIYIAFIGLGVPDSLFGAAWPAIYPAFHLPVSAANCVTLLISSGTILSSLLSARVINRFKTARVTAVSTSMTAVALLGFSLSGSIFWLCLFAIPLGLGAGAIDSGLNNYVALHYKATHMNFLHCFYGIGVSLSPYLMSLALSGKGGWRGGYRAAFYLQLVISLIMILSLPLWKKADSAEAAAGKAVLPKTLKITQLARIPTVRMVWLIFITSCAIEMTCGIWGSTFLVDSKGMTASAAAKIITVYYAGMTLGRFLSGVLSAKLSGWRIIRLGWFVVFGAILLLMLPLPRAAAGVGLFLIGLGNGPVFPNLTHLTPQNFGKDVSQSVIGSQLAAAYIGSMAMPAIFGGLAQAVGTGFLPYYLLGLFAVMTGAVGYMIKMLKKQGRYTE